MEIFLLLIAALEVYCQHTYTVPLLGKGPPEETYMVRYQFINPRGSDAAANFNDGVSVTIPTKDVNHRTMLLAETELPTKSQIQNKTRVITTTGDVDLQVITTINGHSEGIQAIPNSELGTEYYVSTMCALGGFCQLVIASTVPGTTLVYVKLPAEVDEIGFCIGNGTWLSKEHTTITLNYPEVVQLETTHDLTGTRVYANNSVAVVAGSRSKPGSTLMYHLAEQLVPVTEWGFEFYILAIGNTTYGNIVHITSYKRRTFVEMDGFPTVELAGYGQTIKRRIQLNSPLRIKALRPVQVMLYTGFTDWANETIKNPGMTLVPATAHFRSTHYLSCIDDNIEEVHIVNEVDDSVIYQHELTLALPDTKVNVPYRQYELSEFRANTGGLNSISGSSSRIGGIMTCKGSAIFPVSRLVKNNAGSCETTPGYPGDLVDNDCDGVTDEDHCFENKMFTTSYSIDGRTLIGESPKIVDVNDFVLIKLRLKSCGSVKLELVSSHPLFVAARGKIVVSIAKERFVMYKCFTDCTEHRYKDTTSVLEHADCDTLVPYWFVQSLTADRVCMDIGSFPDYDCSDPATTFNVIAGADFKELRLFGLYSNAVFYYDVFLPDCGKLDSDWRCDDSISNCWEYEDDLCTNSSYTIWVNSHCRKYCGVCNPDSIGKMFAVIRPSNSEVEIEYTLIPTESGLSYTSWNRNTFSSSFSTEKASTKTDDEIDILLKNIQPGSSEGVDLVYTTIPSYLTATVREAGWGIITIPVYPLDALGTEYMLLLFNETSKCDIVSADGMADLWLSRDNSTLHFQINPHLTWPSDVLGHIGVAITASRPVAVFCSYKDPVNPGNNYWAQLLPTSSWGTEYIVPALNVTSPSVLFSATIRLLSTNVNTRIELYGDFQAIFILDNRGEHVDQAIDPAVTYNITANFPIGIAVRYIETLSGAASVITPPAVDNYMDSTPIFLNNLTGSVDISVVNSDFAKWTESAEPYTTSRLFYSTSIDGTFAVSIFNNFSAPVHGVEVYYHPVHQSGQLVKDLRRSQICTVTQGTPGDGIDNDCDGLVDEEVMCITGYGSFSSDTDGDGGTREDCSASIPVSPSVPPPEVPICFYNLTTYMFAPPIIIANTSQCLMKTECPCKWVEELQAYNNLSQAEKDHKNMQKILQYWTILKIDKTLLTASVSEKESAEDTRTSSANIGITGLVLLCLIFASIVIIDLINVVRYFQAKRRTSAKTDG